MCTVGYLKDLGLAFKNRDKDRKLGVTEEIIANGEVLACLTANADYFSWGLNRHGVGFITTAINPPEWCNLIYAHKNTEADIFLNNEYCGFSRPVVRVSERLKEYKSAAQALEIFIQEFFVGDRKSMGYHLIFFDKNSCFVSELYGQDIHTSEISSRGAVTNHFKKLTYGPNETVDYPSSYRRLAYAEKESLSVESTEALMETLKPQDMQRRQQIWRDGVFHTVSSSILDFENLCVYYSNSVNENFRKISITGEGVF